MVSNDDVKVGLAELNRQIAADGGIAAVVDKCNTETHTMTESQLIEEIELMTLASIPEIQVLRAFGLFSELKQRIFFTALRQRLFVK